MLVIDIFVVHDDCISQMTKAHFVVYKYDYQITIIARSHSNEQSRVNHVLALSVIAKKTTVRRLSFLALSDKALSRRFDGAIESINH